MRGNQNPEVDSIDQLYSNMVSTPKPEIDVVMPSDQNPEVDSIDQLWFNMKSAETKNSKSDERPDETEKFWFHFKNASATTEVSKNEKEFFSNRSYNG